MAIDRPGTNDAAPARGPERQRRTPAADFLGYPRGMGEPGSPRVLHPRGGKPRGRKSADGVAAQAFEAKPLPGLDPAIERTRVSPALNNKA